MENTFIDIFATIFAVEIVGFGFLYSLGLLITIPTMIGVHISEKKR